MSTSRSTVFALLVMLHTVLCAPALARQDAAPSRELLRACAAGDLIAVRELTDGRPANTEAHASLDDRIAGFRLSHPLHTAAYFGNAEIVKYLIERGADIEAVDGELRTPLLCAVTGDCDIRSARTLLEHGAETEAESAGGFTAVQLATLAGRTDMVAELVRHGANVRHAIDIGIDDLFTIAIVGAHGPPVLDELLAITPLPAADDMNGMGPAFACPVSSNVPAFQWLKKQNYDIAEELDDSAILLTCVRDGKVAMLAELLTVPAKYRTATASGQTLLQLAAELKDPQVRETIVCLVQSRFGKKCEFDPTTLRLRAP